MLTKVGKCYCYCFLEFLSLLCFQFEIFPFLDYLAAVSISKSFTIPCVYFLQIFEMLFNDFCLKSFSGSWFERIDEQKAHENSVEVDEREAEA